MARLRAAVAAPRSNRVRSGARLSHHASYRSAILSRSLGLTVRASPRTSSTDGGLADAEGPGDAGRAVAHHVQGAQPQAGAAGVQLDRSHRVARHGQHGGGGAAGRSAAAGDQVGDGGRGHAGGGGDADVGAAVPAQAADVGAGGTGTGGRLRRVGGGGAEPAGVLMLISVHRLGLVVGRVRAPLAGPAGGVQGPGDLGVAEAGLAGGGGQRAQVGGGVGLEGAVGGPEQAGVAVAFGLGGDPAGQVAEIPVRGPGAVRAAGAGVRVAAGG